MMGYGYGMMIGAGVFYWLILLLLLGVIIYVAYKIINLSKEKEHVSSLTSNRLLEIFNERYARGEVSEEEYGRMKKTLLE